MRPSLGSFVVLAAAAACTEPRGVIVLDLKTTSATVLQRDSVAVPITVGSQHLRGDVVMTATGLPAGVTASFGPPTTSGATHTLRLVADSVAPPGTDSIRVIATAGTVADTAAIQLTVAVRGSYLVRISPDSQLVEQGEAPGIRVAIDRQGGFAQPVSLAVSVAVDANPSVGSTALTPTSATATITDTATNIPFNATTGSYRFFVKVVASTPGLVDVRDSAKVTVLAPFFVWPDTNVLYAGTTRQLVAISDNLGWYSHLRVDRTPDTWSSDNIAVATVNAAGVVTARQPGDATISAALKNRIVNVKVRVLPAPPTLRFAMVSGESADTADNTRRAYMGCGVSASDARLWCWGTPFPGDTGWTDRCQYWDRIGPDRSKYYQFNCLLIPRPVPTDLRFQTVSVHWNSGCAVATTARVYCWGSNAYGEMGDGSVDASTHSLSPIGTTDQFQAVNAYNTRCALRADSALLCWGENRNGAAGIGSLTPDPVTTPTRIGGSLTFRKTADLTYSASCALTADSTAYCWGPGVNALAPTAIASSVKFADVSTPCALDAAGQAWCWGGQAQATQVSGAPAFARLSGGLALTAGGDAYNLSSGTSGWTATLLDRQGLKLQQFSQQCGLSLDGRAYCWNVVTGKPRLVAGQ